MRDLAFAVLSLGVVVTAIPNPLIKDSPYVTGQCSFHLTETQTCEPDVSNLYAVITLRDAADNAIGDTPAAVGINAGAPYTFYSNLPDPIVVTGEHENDYIQFTYGDLSWASSMPNGGAYCAYHCCIPSFPLQDLAFRDSKVRRQPHRKKINRYM